MIGISTRSFDLDGSFILTSRDANLRLGSMGRRATKTATLDGGISIYDTGLSQGDREFDIQLTNPTEAFINKIKTLMTNHSSFLIVTTEGAFTGMLLSINETLQRTSFKISIESKVA